MIIRLYWSVCGNENHSTFLLQGGLKAPWGPFNSGPPTRNLFHPPPFPVNSCSHITPQSSSLQPESTVFSLWDCTEYICPFSTWSSLASSLGLMVTSLCVKHVYPKMCTWMFIAVLFLTVKKLRWTRWQNSSCTWSTFLSKDTSGIHLQTQKCLQNTSWDLTGVHDQWKGIYRTTKFGRMKELGGKTGVSIGLDLPSVGGRTEVGVQFPHGSNCLDQRRNILGWEWNNLSVVA